MLNQINCCNLALIAFIGNIVQLVFFFNYSLKIKDKNIELEKNEKKQESRIKELERSQFEERKKNGTEMRRLEQLEQEIKELKQKQAQNSNQV